MNPWWRVDLGREYIVTGALRLRDKWPVDNIDVLIDNWSPVCRLDDTDRIDDNLKTVIFFLRNTKLPLLQTGRCQYWGFCVQNYVHALVKSSLFTQNEIEYMILRYFYNRLRVDLEKRVIKTLCAHSVLLYLIFLFGYLLLFVFITLL